MSDIVERLRIWASEPDTPDQSGGWVDGIPVLALTEAADEITRLRAENERLQERLTDADRLRKAFANCEDVTEGLRARVEELEEALGRACMDLANEADHLSRNHIDNLRALDSSRRIQATVDRLMPLRRALTYQERDDG